MGLSVGILTVSDRCSRGEAEDRGGPALRELAEARGWRVARAAIVADEAELIAAAGSRGRSLVVNFPGSPSGARQSFEAVAGLIEHAVAILGGAGHESPAGSGA